MEGVNILSASAQSESDIFLVCVFAVFIILIGIIGLCCESVTGIFAVLAGVVILACALTQSPRTEYKVTVSDEVSFNDFMEKYEIISQEGEIYTVRERECEEE